MEGASRQVRSHTTIPGARTTNQSDRGSRLIHDPEFYKTKKMQESANFFKSTRVQTCSHVVMKNGKAVAMAFPLEKTGWKAANSYVNTKRSTESASHSR